MIILIQHEEKAKSNNEDLDMLQLQLGERICENKKKLLQGPWSERTADGRDEAGKQDLLFAIATSLILS